MKIKLKTTVEHLEALREVLPNVEINSQTFTTWNLNSKELKAKQSILEGVIKIVHKRALNAFYLGNKGKTTLTLAYHEAYTLFLYLKYQKNINDVVTNPNDYYYANIMRIFVSELDQIL